MLDEAGVVTVAASVELVPDASQYGCSTESIVLYLLDVLRIDSTQGDDLLVDDAGLVCLANFFRGIVAHVTWFGDFVEYRVKEQVVVAFLVRLEFFQRMARTAEVSLVVFRCVRITFAQVDSLQLVFFLQVEMAMNDDALVVLFRDEGE